MFSSNLEITKRGCYEFYLESDDGSKLWIEEKLIINNDKPHRMIIMRDTMMMNKGSYPIKVWYYNAYVNQYGLILKCRALPDSATCEPSQKRNLPIDLNNILFDFNSYVITPAGLKELDKLCDELNQLDFTEILIIGYTDNVGTAKYNDELSLKRAQSILVYLKAKLDKSDISFTAEGRGYSNPVVSDEDSRAQRLNRRVEIYVE